ncbi:hypothetical protein EsH8_IX_000861 [Colletotrichum jinshuiense]
MPFTCDHDGCGRSYLRKEHLTRHKKEHAATPSFCCPSCGTSFTRGDTLRRHMVLHGPSAPPTRVAQACVPCHRTKTRCDGQQPVCSTCSDKGKCCKWPETRGKSQSERSSLSPSNSSAAGCTPPNPVILPQPTAPCLPPSSMHVLTSTPPTPTTMPETHDVSPESILSETMRLQLQNIYFTEFHPHWPLLHRQMFETTAQHTLLTRAVITVGLWFAASPDSKALAIKLHDHLLVETGNKLLDLLEQSRQGLLSPRAELLPTFQATLIATILVPYRADKSMDNVMMTHAMLLEVFKATGVYEQSQINLGSQVYGHGMYPWLFQELYQRLAVFQFKLHLILQAIFVTIHPALRISRNAEPAMLRIKVPLPLMMWDSPATQWYGMIPTDPELLDMDDDESLVIGKMCEKATTTMDNKALVPLLSWDRCLGMAIWCWCLRGTESDKEFLENIKPFVLDPLKGASSNPGIG